MEVQKDYGGYSDGTVAELVSHSVLQAGGILAYLYVNAE